MSITHYRSTVAREAGSVARCVDRGLVRFRFPPRVLSLLRATRDTRAAGIQRRMPAGRWDEDESVPTNTRHRCAWAVRNHERLRWVLSQLRHGGRRCRHVLGFQHVSRHMDR